MSPRSLRAAASSARGALLVALPLALAACSAQAPGAAAIEDGTPVASPDASASGAKDAARTFYVDVDSRKVTLVLPTSSGAADGWLGEQASSARVVDSLQGPDAAGNVSFRELVGTGSVWFSGRITAGVMVGRFAAATYPDRPPSAAYLAHFTGWNRAAFEQSLVPRVYDLLLDGQEMATLRIDSLDGHLVGRLKTYATVADGVTAEREELDLKVTNWDGTNLSFQVARDGVPTRFELTASGRTVNGTYVAGAGGSVTPLAVAGRRVEVLTYGLVARPPAVRTAWQTNTRAALRALMMAGNSSPATVHVTTLAEGLPPLSQDAPLAGRDDDPGAHPAAYHRTELRIDATYVDPLGGPPIARVAHAWLAVPDAEPPRGGFPAVLALNGHGGSAQQTFDPDDVWFWYGDGFARRDRVVLSVDISHRPLADRARLYGDTLEGDDPASGNGAHPAIAAAGFDSDWEEDGERVADVIAGRIVLQAMPDVDARSITVAGLSMGGEVTTYAAALDTELAAAVPAGFSPDLWVMARHQNHPCWEWQHGDVSEYLSASDLHALVAPRPLVVETGKLDATFSSFATPFSADKQVARRSRAAYGADTDAFSHYLHYDVHRFHVGDHDPVVLSAEEGVRTPTEIHPAKGVGISWQTSADTALISDTLFRLLDLRLGTPGTSGT